MRCVICGHRGWMVYWGVRVALVARVVAESGWVPEMGPDSLTLALTLFFLAILCIMATRDDVFGRTPPRPRNPVRPTQPSPDTPLTMAEIAERLRIINANRFSPPSTATSMRALQIVGMWLEAGRRAPTFDNGASMLPMAFVPPASGNLSEVVDFTAYWARRRRPRGRARATALLPHNDSLDLTRRRQASPRHIASVREHIASVNAFWGGEWHGQLPDANERHGQPLSVVYGLRHPDEALGPEYGGSTRRRRPVARPLGPFNPWE